mgnify:CR=1 FL=1
MAKSNYNANMLNMFKMNASESVLSVLFVVYFILGYPLPDALADIFDTTAGRAFLFLIVVILFASASPIVGILALLVAFDIVRRAGNESGASAIRKYVPSEAKKMSQFNTYNQFPYTLEQEMVALRTVKRESKEQGDVSFKPVLENDHNAALVSQTM